MVNKAAFNAVKDHELFKKWPKPPVTYKGEKVDLIITIGDDSTVLHAQEQFTQQMVPPILGFSTSNLQDALCNFKYKDHRKVIADLLNKKEYIDVDERIRLTMAVPDNPDRKIYDRSQMKQNKELGEMNIDEYQILNQVVLQREAQPLNLELYFDG